MEHVMLKTLQEVWKRKVLWQVGCKKIGKRKTWEQGCFVF